MATRHGKNLLALGNQKLGEGLHVFSIPAVKSCPGLTSACVKECYARKNRFRFRSVKAALARNYKAARDPSFARRMALEIQERGIMTVRIHSAGDFFSAAYAEAWTEVAAACEKVTFYAYTRSWRVEAIRPALECLAALENVQLWYSADRASGMPLTPEGVKVAWLQTIEDEDIPGGVDLVFRPRRLRKKPGGKIPLGLVCPADLNSEKKVTCGGCQRCF